MTHYTNYTPETEPLKLAMIALVCDAADWGLALTPTEQQSKAILDLVIGYGFTQQITN